MATKKKPIAKKPRVETAEVYRDAEGDWRWQGRAANGKIVAESGEGYVNRMYAAKMARALCAGATVEFH